MDKLGNTIDFHLSPTGNGRAAKRFTGKGLKEWEKLATINTDKALAELRTEGESPKETVHRQVKYLDNLVEADHDKLKMLIRPVRGLKGMKTAHAIIKGFEVMRALRRGQPAIFNITGYIHGEARIFERAFGIVPSALTEAVQLLSQHLEAQPA